MFSIQGIALEIRLFPSNAASMDNMDVLSGYSGDEQAHTHDGVSGENLEPHAGMVT
jgi:hypothetical protein